MKKYFLPNGNAQRGTWISNFDIKLKELGSKVGATKDDTDSVHADALAFVYSLLLSAASLSFEHQCATYQLSIRNSPNGTEPIDIPVLAVVGVAPAPVPSGIFTRIGLLVKRIKASKGYTDDIGRALGIIGAEMEAKNATDDVQPKLSGKMVGGFAQLKYTKGANNGIRIESRRGTESDFTLLDKINKTIYSDKRPNLIAGQPEKREYRAWFFVGDEVVGQVSAVISITVPGA